jgi:hypothetical protein
MAIDQNCDDGHCEIAMRYEVSNIGSVDAAPFSVTISLQPGDVAAQSVLVPERLAAPANPN